MTQPHQIDREAVALLPCPFCGGPARECYNGDVPFGMYWVLCETCHACPGDKSSREEAIAAWNRRPVPEAVAWRYRHKGPLPGEYDGWVLTTDGGFVRGFLAAQGGYEVQALAALPTQGGEG